MEKGTSESSLLGAGSPLPSIPFRGFLRNRFTLRRLTERRKPSTGRRSCFSQDMQKSFSLLQRILKKKRKKNTYGIKYILRLYCVKTLAREQKNTARAF